MLYYANRVTKHNDVIAIREKIKNFLNEINIDFISEVENINQLYKYLYPNIIKIFLKILFSITNSQDKKHKILTILGVKIKFKRKKYE